MRPDGDEPTQARAIMSKPAAVPIEQLTTEYYAGATVRELGARYGCSFQNIAHRLATAGLQMRPTREPIPTAECPTCGKRFWPVTRKQRFCRSQCIRKKAVCVRGHPLTEDNRYHFPSSSSRCKECAKERDRAWRKRKKLKGHT